MLGERPRAGGIVNWTAGQMFAMFFVSVIGWAVFAYGKKQRRPPQLAAGVLLMVYPYFVPGLLAMCAVGVGIVGLLWLAVRVGW